MVTDLRSGLVLAAMAAWQQVLRLGPYVIGGIVLAALLGQLDLPRRLQRLFNGGGPLPILSAACVGSVSPFSTYGTVPVLLQLLREGASPGPALAFLVSSSMLNPQLFFLVLGGLGPRVALAQTAGVLILGCAAGTVAARLSPSRFLHPIALYASPPSGNGPLRFSWRRLRRDLLMLSGWIGLTFTIGVILGAVLQVFLPAQWVTGLLGDGRWSGVILAGVLGIPLYACGGSAVPVLAGLLHTGMSNAAAVAFLLSGPATRVSSLAAVGSLLNRKALVTYVVYIVLGAVLIGLLLG